MARAGRDFLTRTQYVLKYCMTLMTRRMELSKAAGATKEHRLKHSTVYTHYLV